uniref:IRS-type PTB domain-containing protein n=1 Tax=Salarias fasciatus TaxID=181472 RepID=A0A672H172_SALFA
MSLCRHSTVTLLSLCWCSGELLGVKGQAQGAVLVTREPSLRSTYLTSGCCPGNDPLVTQVIRLADCIRVTELEVGGAPRDTGSFLVETTDKIYVFAADRRQLDDWTHTLCEVAFPVGTHTHAHTHTLCDFRVCVRRTEASDRCGLRGDLILRADRDVLQLLDQDRHVLLSWEYTHLRRFGRDRSSFSFEAGRRCVSGEGSFEFQTRRGNQLFQAVDAAINLQRTRLSHRKTCGPGPAVPAIPAGPGSPQTARCPTSPQTPPPAPRVAPPPARESEYSLPFDTVGRNPRRAPHGGPGAGPGPGADPLYDSIDDLQVGKTLGPAYARGEHIYDEPEGTAAAPPPMRGDAWRIMGTAADPRGHQFPYNPRVDDYAVPKRVPRTQNCSVSMATGPGAGPDQDQVNNPHETD